MSRLLAPAAWIFRAGVACRSAAYRKRWLPTRRLRRPVVSVGNISVGGTGKTPFVEFLARRLLARGRKPAILTRGYGRESGADLIVIEPAPAGSGPAKKRTPDPRAVGDEPALLARHLPEVPIVVSADRFRAGKVAEDRFEVDMHILDDGFQHLGLARSLDIVLLDASEDYQAGLLPAGRLREPLSALARAQVIILTKTENRESGVGSRDLGPTPNSQFPTPISCVKEYAPKAQVFQAVTEMTGIALYPEGVVQDDADSLPLPVFAFCGIAKPPAFFRGLQDWGFHLAGQRVFRDHHCYSPKDLEELEKAAGVAGATVMLTTEKDAMNLLAAGRSRLPILVWGMAMRVREQEAFEEALFSALGDVTVKGR